jgi:hypothetical protein
MITMSLRAGAYMACMDSAAPASAPHLKPSADRCALSSVFARCEDPEPTAGVVPERVGVVQ